MSIIAAGPIPATLSAHRCSWTWHWKDVDLRCTDTVVPGTTLCPDHLIEHAAGLDDAR